MKELLDLIYSLPITSPLLEKKGSFVVEETLGTGLLFASIYKKEPGNYALIANNLYSAQRLYEFLLNFLSDEDVAFFPGDELLRAETLASSRELLSQRLYALGQIAFGKKGKILVTHPGALLRYLPDPALFKKKTLRLRVGDRFDLRQLKAELLDVGYQAVGKVERSLQYASRGDILDIYTVSSLDPIRIEFFDDEVESIRAFDVRTQQSKADLEECWVLPATDTLLSDEEITDFAQRASNIIEDEAKLKDGAGKKWMDMFRSSVSLAMEDIVGKTYRSDLYKYFGFACSAPHSVLEYFDPKIIYVASKNAFIDSSSRLIKEADDFYRELYLEGRLLPNCRAYMDIKEALKPKTRVVYAGPFSTSSTDYSFQAHKISLTGTSIASVLPSIQSYLAMNEKVVLSLPDSKQRETVCSMLSENNIPFEKTMGFLLPEGHLGILETALSEGFEIPALSCAFISSSELFRHKAVASRFVSRFKEGAILRSYEDLRPGDYVVHEYNGIGQFLDIKTIETDGVHRDYLHLAYANNEFLYVPLEQFRLVRKYAGREGVAPKLSRLSTHDWEKRKAKIKERVNELADRLISLYGDRAKLAGFAFPPDDEFQKPFEDEFPFTLTPDQQKALNDIKADMEKPLIMDRLLCGDVGFGKTEVAFRAAFKAISAGKQVALLCPTTLLARQHYEVASERFAQYGIHLALFSRLVPEREQKASAALLADGKIDLAIGTHRLLSKEIVFKDLGLLIVDEEQRFGVEQKERIKEIKRNVDVLTLSATPIPRTLQMSLVGIRPLSEINTAPAFRMPIQTYVTPFKENVIQELIERELGRHGQVYYVHNRVESIYAVANRLAARIPGAEVGVVHGKMEKEQVEEVMEKFYDGTVNLLVCTSIIENGIDVPNANMLIVEDADHFGLAQLYQIKGRVGRGNRIAYAYLTYREKKEMNDEAQKRLRAIQEFTELGSGYKIAQRDLMIRGAGDILGPEQAGFIDSVGLDLYLKMLNEAVEARKTGVEPEPPKAKKMFNIDAYIPSEYASKGDKLELYQELEDAKSEGDITSFSRKIRDIYGKIPPEVALLISKKRIDLLSENEEFETLAEQQDRIDVDMSPLFTKVDGIATELFDVLVPYLASLKVSFSGKRLRLSLYKGKEWLPTLEKVMKATHRCYAKHRTIP